MNDSKKQRDFRDYYDNTDYFDSFQEHYGTEDSAFNLYARRYIFSIYYPRHSERVADLGCGWGNISLTLQRAGFEVVGVDYSVKSIDICRRSASTLGVDPDRYLCGDVSALPLADSSFDVVYTAGVVEHLFPDIHRAFVAEARRVLRPGGRLIIGTPNPGHFLELMKRRNIVLKEDASHVDYKTMPRLVEELKATGFTVEHAGYYASHIRPLAMVERASMKFLPFMRRRICIRAVKNV